MKFHGRLFRYQNLLDSANVQIVEIPVGIVLFQGFFVQEIFFFQRCLVELPAHDHQLGFRKIGVAISENGGEANGGYLILVPTGTGA